MLIYVLSICPPNVSFMSLKFPKCLNVPVLQYFNIYPQVLFLVTLCPRKDSLTSSLSLKDLLDFFMLWKCFNLCLSSKSVFNVSLCPWKHVFMSCRLYVSQRSHFISLYPLNVIFLISSSYLKCPLLSQNVFVFWMFVFRKSVLNISLCSWKNIFMSLHVLQRSSICVSKISFYFFMSI